MDGAELSHLGPGSRTTTERADARAQLHTCGSLHPQPAFFGGSIKRCTSPHARKSPVRCARRPRPRRAVGLRSALRFAIWSYSSPRGRQTYWHLRGCTHSTGLLGEGIERCPSLRSSRARQHGCDECTRQLRTVAASTSTSVSTSASTSASVLVATG